jgi:mannose-6-phosphate isomerase-like protein (cupin superfamily)
LPRAALTRVARRDGRPVALAPSAARRETRAMPVLDFEQLPLSNISRELVGADHGGLDVSIIFVDAAPGRGPSLHRHPYAEVFIVQEGRATFVLGDEELEVQAGQIAIAPAGVAHAFTNTGDGPLRQVDIHLSPTFQTEWLEDQRAS